MPSKNPDPRPEEIVALLGEAVNEPERFNELTGTWNTFFELGKFQEGQSFADVEAAAITSVAAMSEATPHASVGRQVGEMLENFESPAYLVRENGQCPSSDNLGQ